MKESKLIASVVVFKELHDSNKDVYDIIAEFLKSAIIINKKWKFNSYEILVLIEKEFDFKLPEAVIKTAIKKRLINSGFLSNIKGEYVVNNIESKIDPIFDEKYKKNKEIYGKTEKEFIEFIQSTRKIPLTENDKNKIIESLNQYLLGNGSNEFYSQEISTFIIKNKNNLDFLLRLNVIKEGLVLYSGVKYTADINELGKWDKDLTIFLDSEILFYFVGYNGLVYKEIFYDFFNLVKEINQATKNNTIKLKYFEETERAILDFFHVATLIIEGKLTLDPSKTAMKEIINGCSTKSDIVVKRNKFFIDLKTSGIHKEENRDYYQDYSLNIEDKNVIEIIENLSIENKKDFDEKTCKDYLKLFTKINVLRKGLNNQGFENSKYLLLTGNRFVHFLAHSKYVKPNEKDIPFATDIDYITDKFWFKLKKGFGVEDNKPKLFDYITKAQIILSGQINNTVQEKFTALNEEYKSGKITRQEAISLIYELRESSLKPEEILSINIDEKINFLNEFSIDEHIREREKLIKKAEDGDKAKKELIKRDRRDRTREFRHFKSRIRLFSFIVSTLFFTAIIILLIFFILIVKYFKQPEDTLLSLTDFIIAIAIIILPMINIKRLNSFKKRYFLQKFKNIIKKQTTYT